MPNTEKEELRKPLYLHLRGPLKARLLHQCERLNQSQAALTVQALIKFLEEEEAREAQMLRIKGGNK